MVLLVILLLEMQSSVRVNVYLQKDEAPQGASIDLNR